MSVPRNGGGSIYGKCKRVEPLAEHSETASERIDENEGEASCYESATTSSSMPNDVLLSEPSEAVSTSTIRKRARDVEERSSSISSSMARPLEPYRYYKKLKSSVDLLLSTISGHEHDYYERSTYFPTSYCRGDALDVQPTTASSPSSTHAAAIQSHKISEEAALVVQSQDNPHYPPTQDMIAGSQLSFAQIADDVGTDPEVALKQTSQIVEKDEEHTSVEIQQHLVDTSAQVSQSVEIHAESAPAEIQATCLSTDGLRITVGHDHVPRNAELVGPGWPGISALRQLSSRDIHEERHATIETLSVLREDEPTVIPLAVTTTQALEKETAFTLLGFNFQWVRCLHRV
ncbi:hypothetical protein WOLCODRAFT_164197 [Wolfiporia cocos MD-104 SS10]|uniref:Uncharacterized protein n=1 Tax=Wolfiporia cocos (strain MD-104) TaxID=742152 RepID=A0A2H3JLG1_WOLCO|nr:hypothetical protein WOLCODRAFT_164197 [Wolfiporia cocos MD-104 SS10]